MLCLGVFLDVQIYYFLHHTYNTLKDLPTKLRQDWPFPGPDGPSPVRPGGPRVWFLPWASCPQPNTAVHSF